MLTKTIPELQQFIKLSDAKSAAYAAQILRAISNKDADSILKREENNLHRYLPVYKKYLGLNLPDLKQRLETIQVIPVIDTLIVLHLIGNFSKPSNIVS